MAGRIPISRLSPPERTRGFAEIEQNLRPQQAVAEATRCLKCDDPPCEKGCPARVPIKQFIAHLRGKNFRGAIAAIRRANILAGICGRICPQEQLCEARCASTDLAEPIAIGALQRFVADDEQAKGRARLDTPVPANGKRVACVGAGPASLGCATELALQGFSVEIFEAKDQPGGLLNHGIPLFRLPREVAEFEVGLVQTLGVTVHTGMPVPDAHSLLELGFDAVFVGIGLPGERVFDLPGDPGQGVWRGSDYLEQVRAAQDKGEPGPALGAHVVVVGGGNVSLDCAATALRLGSRVTLVYRRGGEEMPAWTEVAEEVKEEGVSFEFFTTPQRIIADSGRLLGVECIRTRPGEMDTDGRPLPVPVEGSQFDLLADAVILAVGQAAEGRAAGLELGPKGLLEVDPASGATSVAGIFAGGDITNGGTTVVQAVADGKRAAGGIVAFLMADRVP